MKLSLKLVALFASVLALSTANAADKTGKLQGFDAVTQPGKEVVLKAKLERVIRGLSLLNVNPDVENEALDFYLLEKPVTDPRYRVELAQEELIGTAKTNGSGFAELKFKPKRDGVYKIEARVQQGSDYMALPVPMNLGCYKKTADLVIVDIDLTLTNISSLKLSISSADSVELRTGALDAMSRMFHEMNRPVIYVSGRDAGYLNVTRAWLEENKLPIGPLFVWDFWEKSWSEETFKTNLLKSVLGGFNSARTGIGDTAGDAKAFAANGLTPFILSEDPTDFGAVAVFKDKWPRLLNALANQDQVEQDLVLFANGKKPARDKAWKRLNRNDGGLYAYVQRFRDVADLNLASSARTVGSRVKAREAISKEFDQSSPDKTLLSLLSAWRQDDTWLMSRLYRKPEVALMTCRPPLSAFGQVKVLNRAEPDKKTVVFTLQLSNSQAGETGNIQYELKLIQTEDELWCLESSDF